MHDPPIPLDQRLTDAELRELVDGIQEKLNGRQAVEPGREPPGIKPEMASAAVIAAQTFVDKSDRETELRGSLEVERRSVQPKVGGSSPSCAANSMPATDIGLCANGAGSDNREVAEEPITAAIAEVKATMAKIAANAADPMSDEMADRIFATNGIPPASASVRYADAIPEMADGDIGITKAWANQRPPEPVYVTETYHSVVVSKPAFTRWMADAGAVLRWGAALVALAVILVIAIDYGSAAPGPSVVTFNLRF
jgi:hypothetical protein